MTKYDQVLNDFIEEAHNGQHLTFTKKYASRVKKVVSIKAVLSASLMVDDIDTVLEVLNPALHNEISWFKGLQKSLKDWCNEKIYANRLLQVKNDNEFDIRPFEKAIMQEFRIKENEKPKPEEYVKLPFKNLIDLVEMGARRFGDYF